MTVILNLIISERFLFCLVISSTVWHSVGKTAEHATESTGTATAARCLKRILYFGLLLTVPFVRTEAEALQHVITAGLQPKLLCNKVDEYQRGWGANCFTLHKNLAIISISPQSSEDDSISDEKVDADKETWIVTSFAALFSGFRAVTALRWA